MFPCPADMEKGVDKRTLSAETFENCGNFLIVEDWILLFGIKVMNCEKFFLDIKYLAYL